jgi:hypothetical protein
MPKGGGREGVENQLEKWHICVTNLNVTKNIINRLGIPLPVE